MNSNGHQHEPPPAPTASANAQHLEALIDALGDTPETVIPLRFLREGSCEVLCVGDPADLEGVIIQAFELPEEPIAFGTSAEAVASLLPHLSGWTCINVPAALADDLIQPVASVADASGIRLLDDVHHVLLEPVIPPPGNDALLLAADREELIADISSDMIAGDKGHIVKTLETGHVAGVIRDDEVVALAYTFATSDRHADIGVVTHPEWRGQGLATAVAACVAQAIQQDGRIPVWSCGGTNLASMRIAARLGFREVSRRVYLIPEFDEDEEPGS